MILSCCSDGGSGGCCELQLVKPQACKFSVKAVCVRLQQTCSQSQAMKSAVCSGVAPAGGLRCTPHANDVALLMQH